MDIIYKIEIRVRYRKVRRNAICMKRNRDDLTEGARPLSIRPCTANRWLITDTRNAI